MSREPSKLRRATWKGREALQQPELAARVPARTMRCGRTRFTKQPEIHELDGRAWWHGAMRCRARVCPVCWVGRRISLGHEINHVASEWERQHRVTLRLATLTVRHQATDGVQLVKDVRGCWRAMLQGRAWQEYKRTWGVELIAAEEVTIGENGWHPHLHVLLLPKREHGAFIQTAVSTWWAMRWRKIVARRIGAEHVPSWEHGVDLRTCERSDYLAKLGIELADSGAVKSRSPFDQLRRGEVAQYLDLQLSRVRARDVTWSRGLRPLRDTLPPRPEARTLLSPTAADFEVGASRGNLLAALEAAEAGGEDAARRALWQQQQNDDPTRR